MSTEASSADTKDGKSLQQVTPESVITKGKTFLAVNDYYNAVSYLAEACRLLSEKFSDTADELAEPYIFYGRALLGLAREEQAILGTGVPGAQRPEDEEEDDEEEEEPAEGSAEAKGEGKDEEAKDDKPSDEKVEKKEEGKAEEKKEEKAEEEKAEEKVEKKEEPVEKVANGEASASTSGQQNGDVHQNGDAKEEDGDDAEDENEDDDDGSSNLQYAWEVLELAKMILSKRDDTSEKSQLLAETHRLLGEVALESGNQAGAIGDLCTCLDMISKFEKINKRQIAEVHYQLGLAYSLGNEYSSSIERFQDALKYLDERIEYLKGLKEPPQDADPNYSAEEEIKELQELIPEIKEKIDDMKDMKQQTCKALLASIKGHIDEGSCSNGAGPSGASTSSAADSAGASSSASASADSKPVSDISHLVRKKRKPEDGEAESQSSPCKKPSPLPGKSV